MSDRTAAALLNFAADYINDRPAMYPYRRETVSLLRALASAPQASQPPQGAEPAQFAEQDERGVWRTEDGFPSPENAWEAMLVARARSGHALSYSDTSRIILDLRRAALAAPPQGASSLLPADWADQVEQRLLTWRQRFVNRSGDQLALDDMMGQESIDDLIDFVCAPLSASPLPAPQEPVAAQILGYMVWTSDPRNAALYNLNQRAEAEDATSRWGASITALTVCPGSPLPPLYAAPARDSAP